MTIELLPGEDSSDPTCQTFIIHGEDHSFANSLRVAINYNEHVEFCGYTIVHPTEESFRIRIQTDGMYLNALDINVRYMKHYTETTTAVEALMRGLDTLSEMVCRITKEFEDNLLRTDSYTIEHSAEW